jgi:quinolinate synthase
LNALRKDALLKEIQKLKVAKEVSILAHFYQEGDIQDIADEIGDSFQLAKAGQSPKHKNILLAGVVFMAESVKIMNPGKTVLVPDLEASCSLVKGAPYAAYLEWRKSNPKGIGVTYINSSAEVKSISDVIVTSSNAEAIVKAIPKDRPIFFGPDANLGKYLSRKTGRQFNLWPGACEVHVLFSARRLYELIQKNPDARVIAHPECGDDILGFAHVIGSTSRLLEEVKSNKDYSKFIVATESGILHQMRKARPEAELIQAPGIDEACRCNDCPYMKLNTLEKVRLALESFQPQIHLEEALRLSAAVPLQRMMDIAAGKKVVWPDQFETR